MRVGVRRSMGARVQAVPSFGRGRRTAAPRARRQLCRASLEEYASQLLQLHSPADGAKLESLAEHNDAQAAFIAAHSTTLMVAPPGEVIAGLARAINAVPGLGPSSRVLDIRSGGPHVVQALQARGVCDILAVDVCAEPLQWLDTNSNSACGNDLSVRAWEGDVCELPDFLGSADAIVFAGSLGCMFDARAALLRSMLLLKPGGHILITEPLGREWQNQVSKSDPRHVPTTVPARDELEALVADLALEVVGMEDRSEHYCALLQVPPTRRFKGAPVYLEGDVTKGFGRGSKQMGIPTANLPPAPLQDKIGHLPAGVYFGWAQLQSGSGTDAGVHKMVMNIGYRPTCDDGGGLTVEIHVLHQYAGDFYGEPMRAVALGYIRPEMRFNGLDALVARIKADIGQAKALLEAPEMSDFSQDPFFGAQQ